MVVVGPSGAIDNRISLGTVPATNLTVGADGAIYVANSSEVIAVNESGPYGFLTDLPSGATGITDIAMGPDGLYVVNNRTLSVVDPSNLDVRTGVVDSLDDFSLIAGVTVGSGGEQYVAGAVNTVGGSIFRLARINV